MADTSLLTGTRSSLRLVTGTDQAANTEISETVPAGVVWRLISLRFALVTDANAATRTVAVTFDDGATEYMRALSVITQAASLTQNYQFARGDVEWAAVRSTYTLAPLPDIVLGSGHRIKTVTANRQATDNFGAPLMYVQEYAI